MGTTFTAADQAEIAGFSGVRKPKLDDVRIIGCPSEPTSETGQDLRSWEFKKTRDAVTLKGRRPRMELGFFMILGGLFLICVLISSFAIKRVSSKDLADEYLKVGLSELRLRVEKELQDIEKRKGELQEEMEHLEALEKTVKEKLRGPSQRYSLAPGNLKDAV